MWYLAVYATSGAIVILLLGMTKDFADRCRQAGVMMEEADEFGFDESVLVLFVAVLLLLTWPNLPVAFARRRLRRRK